MNNYETVFIVTPVLSDAQVQEVADKFQGVITENGGQIVNKESWGLRKLAYPIQKKTTGFYFLLEFHGRGLARKHARDAVPPRRAHHPFLNFQAGQVRRGILGETSCKTF